MRQGDSLYTVAGRFGISLNELIQANPHISDPSSIQVGQEICIPLASPVNCPNGQLYTVQTGDTLSGIAQRYGLTLNQLVVANPQITNYNLLYPGQVICIPAVDPGPIPQGECALVIRGTDVAPNARGVALLNFDTNNVLIAAAGLPTASYEFFVAWLITQNVSARIELSPANGVWAGEADDIDVSDFTELIITAEDEPAPLGPLGATVARTSLNQCR